MTDKPGRGLSRGETLVIASHNPGKLAEFEMLLAGRGISLVSAAALALPEPDETEDSFEGNARLKALAAARASGLPALADDSGFCVRALDGAPGIHSARWAGPGRDFTVAMQRVHDAAAASRAPSDDAAWFVSVLCLAWPDGHIETFEGRIDGALCWPPRGSNGHGYDPVFQPEGYPLRFAEMTAAEKNAVSHRARSFALFAAACLP
jgi:XTP/dITP diphosphohydrolase